MFFSVFDKSRESFRNNVKIEILNRITRRETREREKTAVTTQQ